LAAAETGIERMEAGKSTTSEETCLQLGEHDLHGLPHLMKLQACSLSRRFAEDADSPFDNCERRLDAGRLIGLGNTFDRHALCLTQEMLQEEIEALGFIGLEALRESRNRDGRVKCSGKADQGRVAGGLRRQFEPDMLVMMIAGLLCG
jgi:hypothetical protein